MPGRRAPREFLLSSPSSCVSLICSTCCRIETGQALIAFELLWGEGGVGGWRRGRGMGMEEGEGVIKTGVHSFASVYIRSGREKKMPLPPQPPMSLICGYCLLHALAVVLCTYLYICVCACVGRVCEGACVHVCVTVDLILHSPRSCTLQLHPQQPLCPPLHGGPQRAAHVGCICACASLPHPRTLVPPPPCLPHPPSPVACKKGAGRCADGSQSA